MSNALSRLGTANTFDRAIGNLSDRQAGLSSLQEKLTSGKRVLRPSDDPTGAAQAERAATRISRVATDQRALAMQKNSLASAESTLGDAGSAAQAFRELLVSAGNGAYSPADRNTIADQLKGLRDQMFGYANRKDTNGLPLFGALGSAEVPFVQGPGGVTFQGIGGQPASTEVAVPFTLDGAAAWMNVPTGNGVFTVQLDAANTGNGFSNTGKVADPTLLTGDSYRLQFTVAAGVTTFDVLNVTQGTTVAAGQPYVPGQDITFDGMQLSVSGTPANGDRFDAVPSVRSNVFSVLDQAIADVRGAGTNAGRLAHGIAKSLMQIDTAMERLQSARGLAGDLLNRVDRIDDNQGARAIQLEADRSRAEDLDMVQGFSDFKNQETGYSAALQSYAQIQKLSLFNFIN